MKNKNIISDPGDEVTHLYQDKGNDEGDNTKETPQDPIDKYTFRGKEYSNVEIPYTIDNDGKVNINTSEMMDSVEFQKKLYAIRTSSMYADIRKKGKITQKDINKILD